MKLNRMIFSRHTLERELITEKPIKYSIIERIQLEFVEELGWVVWVTQREISNLSISKPDDAYPVRVWTGGMVLEKGKDIQGLGASDDDDD